MWHRKGQLRPPQEPYHLSLQLLLQVLDHWVNGDPLTPSTESIVKEVASVAWEGVKTSLVFLSESSCWFLPLKSAIGGFD